VAQTVLLEITRSCVVCGERWTMEMGDPTSYFWTIIEGEWFWICPLHRFNEDGGPVSHYSRALLLEQSKGMVVTKEG
jgi:hypothetical protein